MSRPQRIEFENAYYHVMNRGAGRCDVFHDVLDREQFLSIVYDAHKQFGIEIHAYCLMSKHYHLLIKTPRAANQVLLVSDGDDLSTKELLCKISVSLDKPLRLLPVPCKWISVRHANH